MKVDVSVVTGSSRKYVSRVISFLFIATLAALSARLQSFEQKFIAPVDDVSFQWHPTLYRIITFGHAPAAVDLLLIRFFGEDTLKHVNSGAHAKAYYLIDLATDLDPAFFHLYHTGANYLTVVRNDKTGALKIATKAENYRKDRLPSEAVYLRENVWEQAWRIPFVKGYIHLFEFDDLANAKIAYGELEGMKGVPQVIQQLAERFNRPDGEFEVGIRVLQTMLWAEQEKKRPDLKIIEQVSYRLRSLALSLYFRRANRNFKNYIETDKRFKKKGKLEPSELRELWAKFSVASKIPSVDDWGGKIFINDQGQISSTTPRSKVLGLE